VCILTDKEFKDFLWKGTHSATLSHYKAQICAVELDLVKYEREYMHRLFKKRLKKGISIKISTARRKWI
jgi:hypothetical protein